MKYSRVTFFNKFIFALAILALILLIAVFIIELIQKQAKAENQIKIYPSAYVIGFKKGIEWQNIENAFSQDLPELASLFEFNETNSAFIQGINEEIATTTESTITEATTTTAPEPILVPENTTTTIIEETTTESTTTTIPEETTTESTTTTIPEETTTESTTTTIPEETTTTTESTTTTTIPPEPTTTTEPISFFKKIFGFVIPKVKAEEKISEEIASLHNSIIESSLIFNNFYITEDFELSQVENVQLRFSLAGKGQEGDKIIIRYFYQDNWHVLDKLSLSPEISNNINGGYFLYSLPVINNHEDLRNLYIEFKYQGSQKAKVYLDSVWLEINYLENNSQLETEADFYQESKFSRALNIDKNPNFACAVEDFTINLQAGEKKAAKVILYKKDNTYYEVTLGNMPYGIKAYFAENQDSIIRGSNLDNNLLMYLTASPKAQKGSFNLPIIFSKKIGDKYFDYICQFNLLVE